MHEISDNSPSFPLAGSESKTRFGFETTLWGLVQQAGSPESPDFKQSLNALCCKYWRPLYAYARKHGFQTSEAQDLTQDFFAHMVERNGIGLADPGRGKFRSFLLASFKNFMLNHIRKEDRQKRGGGAQIMSLDLLTEEERFLSNLPKDVTPEEVYDRNWARSIMDAVMSRIAAEYAKNGQTARFEALRVFVSEGSPTISYSEVAAQLHTTESSVKSAIYRLRRQVAEALRAEIAQTVNHPWQIDQEIRHLFHALFN